jgi:hypothetical protein
MSVLNLTFLLNHAVSLADAVNRVKTLEGKLSANTKALKEAEKMRRRGCCCQTCCRSGSQRGRSKSFQGQKIIGRG